MQLFRFLGHTFLSIFYPNCALVALSVTAYGSRVTSRNPSVPQYTLGIRRVVQNTLTYRVILYVEANFFGHVQNCSTYASVMHLRYAYARLALKVCYSYVIRTLLIRYAYVCKGLSSIARVSVL